MYILLKQLFWKILNLFHIYIIVFNVVSELDDTVKKEILKTTSDGKLTEDEKESLKNMAMKMVNEQIADPIKELATNIVGNLDNYISTIIENCVTSLRTYGRNYRRR